MKILVTGAAGFIGSHTCEMLLAQEHSVVALDNFDSYYPPRRKRRNVAALLQHPNFKLAECDFGDRLGVSDILKAEPCDTVLHLAGQAGGRLSVYDPLKHERTNASSLIAMLEALREYGPRRIVAASSAAVYDNSVPPPWDEAASCEAPLSPYGATKRAAEIFLSTYAGLYDFKVTLVRLFSVYGPRQRPDMAIAAFARNILTGAPVTVYGDGRACRDYSYVSDIAAGLAAAVARAPEDGLKIYNLGSQSAVPLSEIVPHLERICGKTAKLDRQGAQPGDPACVCAKTARAQAELGFAPKVSLVEGLEKTVAWVRQDLRLDGIATV